MVRIEMTHIWSFGLLFVQVRSQWRIESIEALIRGSAAAVKSLTVIDYLAANSQLIRLNFQCS